jgi:hypothetical protein
VRVNSNPDAANALITEHHQIVFISNGYNYPTELTQNITARPATTLSALYSYNILSIEIDIIASAHIRTQINGTAYFKQCR